MDVYRNQSKQATRRDREADREADTHTERERERERGNQVQPTKQREINRYRVCAILLIAGLTLAQILNTASINADHITIDNIMSKREKQRNLFTTNNTIITAYYNLSTTRHSSEEYDLLMTRLFSSNDAMIIFTSPDLVTKLSSMRQKPERTIVIPQLLNETRISKMFSLDYWKSLGIQHGRTNNVKGHEVFWVWHAKLEFLKRGSDLNPFRSNFFAWFDAGMVRWDEFTNTTLLQRIPPELPRDKMMILNVTRVTNKQKNVMMGAGVFGGYKGGIDSYYHRYHQVIEKTKNATEKAHLVAIEQKIMYETCVETPGLCFVIRPEQHWKLLALKYPMFYMLAFLNSVEYQYMKERGLTQTHFGDYTAP